MNTRDELPDLKETDRTTAVPWVPFGEGELLAEGDRAVAGNHRFAYFAGRQHGYTHVTPYEEAAEEPEEGLNWTGTIMLALAVTAVAVSVLIGLVVAGDIRHAHHTAASAPAAAGPAHNSGQVFAWLVVIVVVVVAARGLARFIKGG
jgi:lysylphosphatidylglycerol synthetase-like protein (DUF2156 family)